MTKQGELFGVNEPLVPGLLLVRDAVTQGEETELAARIDGHFPYPSLDGTKFAIRAIANY